MMAEEPVAVAAGPSAPLLSCYPHELGIFPAEIHFPVKFEGTVGLQL